MKKNIQRRSFLEKMSLGISSLTLLPFLGSANKNTLIMDNKRNAIKKIKPLGFQWETSDPFLFCVHHEDFFPKGNEEMGPDPEFFNGRHMGQDFIVKDGFRMYHGSKVPGFPGHPHRGFETITVVRKGLVDHADSTGAAGRYGNGDVQWMTAGKGVQHSEMFPLLKSDEENPMELFQIWLNLPRKSKMVKPHFKMIWSEEVPRFSVKDSNGIDINVEVLVGALGMYMAPSAPPDSWAADTNNQVAIYNVRLEPGAIWT
jgi:redox-sensitive bicupin YhaK (pirin superfamily)